MEHVAMVARLKEGSAQRAAELVGAGPPFDLAVAGWQLDEAESVTAAAGDRSESWA
jgi:hypothetical protein